MSQVKGAGPRRGRERTPGWGQRAGLEERDAVRARWGITVAERLLELELTAMLCLPGVAFSFSVDTEHM